MLIAIATQFNITRLINIIRQTTIDTVITGLIAEDIIIKTIITQTTTTLVMEVLAYTLELNKFY